jgi:hypothetical protein
MHALAEALNYAIASGRFLVVNDSCAWDLQVAQGFWNTYMQPVSVCGLPPVQVSARAQAVVDDGERPQPNVDEMIHLLWDTSTSKSQLIRPQGAHSWCPGPVWSKHCVPPDFQGYGSAWWHAHVRTSMHLFHNNLYA